LIEFAASPLLANWFGGRNSCSISALIEGRTARDNFGIQAAAAPSRKKGKSLE